MEPEPAVEYQAASTAHASSNHDLDAGEVSSSPSASWVYNQQKRKWSQVAPHSVNGIDENVEPAVVTLGESTSNNKHKQPMEVDQWPEHTKDIVADDLPGSSTYHTSEADKSLENLQSTEAEDDYDDAEVVEDDDYEYEEDDYDDYVFEEDVNETESDYSLTDKFDDLDLPPGVEASVSWWQKLSSKKTTKSERAVNFDEIDARYKGFKQFDTVQDCLDHHYYKLENTEETSVVQKPPKNWSKRIQHEWKILEKDLPETIFVRVYEERMDLLRAVIIGPAGTPYHDGLFFFDCFFPSTYPNRPPLVHYHSGGLRLNPNLYANGMVCLSLLGTWEGNGCENWKPGKSTILQVLVSIQALVLNAKPYFNEPGYETAAKTVDGEKSSLAYNEETFLLSCKAMLYSLQRPPRHFEYFVAGHFSKCGHTVLAACRAYMAGAQVGCVVGDGVRDMDKGGKSLFRSKLKKLFEELLMEFTVKGADCDVFLAEKVKAGLAKAAAVDDSLKP